MVRDHSDSERRNPLQPYGLLFPINRKSYFICTIPQTGEHIPREGSIRRPIAPWANALTTELHLAPRTRQSRKVGVVSMIYHLQWNTGWISRSSQCSTAGVTKAVVCVILSVGWCISERVAHVVAARFISRYLNIPLSYVWRHITVNKICSVCR